MNRRNFSILGAGYFAILLNYPMVRAGSTTLFVEAYGAKASPQGWLLAVMLLIVTVTAANSLQKKWGFHRTFIATSVVSVIIFITSFWLYQQGIKPGAFSIFAWKEIYIVLQVHLFLAYANAWLPRADFLRWIGPLGGLGSVGGVLGGLITSELARRYGTGVTFMVGQVFV